MTELTHEASLERLPGDLELRAQPLPSSEEWEAAKQRAGVLFGIVIKGPLTWANVVQLASEVEAKVDAAQASGGKLAEQVRSAASRLGIEPGQVDGRLRTTLRRLRARITASPEISGPHPAEAMPGGGPGRLSDRLIGLADDQLGESTMAVIFAELPWTPDVAPAAVARLAREVMAYAEPAPAPAGAVAAVESATGPHANPPQGSRPSAAERTRRTTARGRAFPAFRTAALVAGFAIFGFALAASMQRWQVPREIQARLDEALGRSVSGPIVLEGDDQPGWRAEDVLAGADEPVGEVTFPTGRATSLRLDDPASAAGLRARPGGHSDPPGPPDADRARLLPREPAEHVHRAAHPGDAG